MQSPTPPSLSPVPAGSWWHRNWKWFVPLGCCAATGLFLGCIALFVGTVFGVMRSSGACQEAVTRATSTPAIVQALGSPIEIGWFVTGTLDPGRHAEITIPISGPRGKARIYVVASNTTGKWTFSTLTVKLRATGERISLMEKGQPFNPAPQPAAAPNRPATP